MAADRSQYNDAAADAVSTNGITVRHWFAKLHVDKATHCARFFLDDVLCNVDASGVKGYCGVVGPSSGYWMYHAAARRGCIGAGTQYNTAAIAFQDGGLNTLGFVGYNTVTTVNSSFAGALFKIDYGSAYYVPTDDFGLRYRTSPNGIDTWSAWTYGHYGPLAAGAYLDQLEVGGVSGGVGYYYQVEAFLNNNEGDNIGLAASGQFTLQPITLWPGGYSGPGTTYYINTATAETVDNGGSTRLYTSSDGSGEVNSVGEYWINEYMYYEYAYSAFLGFYSFLTLKDTRYPSGGGGGGGDDSVSYFDYNAYSADSEEAAAAMIGSGQNTGRIYGLNELWYTNAAFTSYAANGYYVFGNLIDGVTGGVYVNQ